VLFTLEGDELYSYQLVHMDGTVKLIEIPVDESFVPNLFVSATLVNDRQVFTDQKQVVVPPIKNFLTVAVKPDRAIYQPREEGTFTVSTRDDAGRPISAEVAFGLVDESIFYIQQDYAGQALCKVLQGRQRSAYRRAGSEKPGPGRVARSRQTIFRRRKRDVR
jgi:alpha-2-macroglobulin